MTSLRHLRIFAAVYDENSMTAASRKLFMTQPSVSQAIKELEREFGVMLFERLSRKLYVTEAGEAVYRYARHIMRLTDELADLLQSSAHQPKLKLGANYTVGTALIHRYIQAFEKRHPEAQITVAVNKSSVLVDLLRKNELDLALMEELPGEADLVEEHFYDDRVVVVGAPRSLPSSCKPGQKSNEWIATPAVIAGERLLLRERGVGVRNLFESRMNELGLSLEPHWESTSTTALIKAAENGLGIAVVPLLLVEEHLHRGSLVEIQLAGMDLSRKLAIVYHRNKYLNPVLCEMITLCRHSEAPAVMNSRDSVQKDSGQD